LAKVAFLLIGGAHQVSHVAPVAAALANKFPGWETVFLAAEERLLKTARKAAEFFDSPSLSFELLSPSILGSMASRVSGHASASKLPLLWRNRRLLNAYDAIVVPECTSTILRRFGVSHPKLIHVPHGAGDRAIAVEPRLKLFDLVLVAGQKTAARMADNGVDPAKLKVIGYPKGELNRRMVGTSPKLFANPRPTVLYNPHFRRSLSSLDKAQSIVRAITEDGGFNLIVAPHIRAFEDASRATRQEWVSLARADHVLVDLGTDRLIDMTYPSVADIYLGEVSSQVYEFLLTPRPCVFVNAHDVVWHDNPDYTFWTLGEVVAPGAVVAALRRAYSSHARFLPAQDAAVASTFARIDGSCENGATAIAAALASH
jgi:hypothetical protein